jgi:hypothetical protein
MTSQQFTNVRSPNPATPELLLSKIYVGPVTVRDPMPAIVILAGDGLKQKTSGFPKQFANTALVSPVAVTVNNAFVKLVASRVPDAVPLKV